MSELGYPKVISVTRMPDGKALEIVKVPQTSALVKGMFKYTVRDKETLNVLACCEDFHRALGEVYGRVKAMEMKELKERAKTNESKLCSNCQCMLEI